MRAVALYLPILLVVALAVRRRPTTAGGWPPPCWPPPGTCPPCSPSTSSPVRWGWWTFDGLARRRSPASPPTCGSGWALLWGAVPLLATADRLVVAALALVAADLVLMPLGEPAVVLHGTWLVGEAVAVATLPRYPGCSSDGGRPPPSTSRGRAAPPGGGVHRAAPVRPAVAGLRGHGRRAGTGCWPVPGGTSSSPGCCWRRRSPWPSRRCGSSSPTAARPSPSTRPPGWSPPAPTPTWPTRCSWGRRSILAGWGVLLGSPAVVAGPRRWPPPSPRAWPPGASTLELEDRFGDAWPAYRRQVRVWWPRWRPAPGLATGTVYVARSCEPCDEVGRFLVRRPTVGLEVEPAETYAGKPLRRITYVGAGGRPGVRRSAPSDAAWSTSTWRGPSPVGWAGCPIVRPILQLVTDAVGGGPATSTGRSRFRSAAVGYLRQRPRRAREDTVEERSPADVVRLMQDEGVEIVDFRFCDLPGLMQHFSTPAHQLTEDGFEEGYGFDGSSIRGFQEIQESDMILVPDPNTAVIDPFREAKTLNLNCFVRDPVTGDSYSRDPRYVAKKAEDYLRLDRAGRHRLLRAGGGVLHLQRRPLPPGPALGHVLGRLGGGHLELGRRREAQPRVQAPVQGGLLPRPAHGPLPGPALEDDPHAGAGGHRDRGAAPRGGHRRPGRDRHALRHPAAHGRQAHALQVRHQVRGLGPRPVGDVHAQAPVPGQRVGHALPPVAVEGRASRCSSPRRATAACPTWPAGTSAGC